MGVVLRGFNISHNALLDAESKSCLGLPTLSIGLLLEIGFVSCFRFPTLGSIVAYVFS